MGNTIGNTYVDVVEVLGLDGEELELEIALEKTDDDSGMVNKWKVNEELESKDEDGTRTSE